MLLPRQKSLLYIYAVLARINIGSSFLVSTTLANLPAENLRKSPRTFFTLRAATTTDTVLVPPGLLGPPEPVRSLKVGQYLNAFRALQYEDKTENLQFTIERVGHSPDIFCLRNFLTKSECAEIRSTAKESGMKEAVTVTKDDTSSRKNCSVAWISSNGQNKTAVNDLVASTANIFLSKDVLSHSSAGVEDLQVLKYGTGGEFVLHHDGEPRILTVIYYINGVGGTWFPLAHTNDDVTEDLCEREPANKAQALDMVKGLQPGKNGLLVKGIRRSQSEDTNDDARQEENEHSAWVNQGDAIAFYNYKDDGSAQLDWRSLHCGLSTTEEEGNKWIANHWYRMNCLADMEN